MNLPKSYCLFGDQPTHRLLPGADLNHTRQWRDELKELALDIIMVNALKQERVLKASRVILNGLYAHVNVNNAWFRANLENLHNGIVMMPTVDGPVMHMVFVPR